MSRTLGLLTLSFAAALLLPLELSTADSREFRRAQRIQSPQLLSVGPAANLPALAGKKIDGRIPLPRDDVRRALQKVFDEWAGPGLRGKLSWHFVRADQLADAARVYVPRKARVRVQGVSNIQINEQAIMRGQAPDGRDLLVSRVTTTARTQVEFNNPFNQEFTTLIGTNDFVLQIFHAIEQRN